MASVAKKQKNKSSNNYLFTPSAEQQAIIDAIKNGQHVAVNAVAGSGKTTTILGLATQCPEKKIIQITYNRALKLEVEKKAKKHRLKNLKILTYHGLACSFYDYTARTDERISDILTKSAPLNPISKSPDALVYDIVIIDEVQDMTPLYFELVHKWLQDIRRSVVLGIMGDHLQGIYSFKGADERFLTLGNAIFQAYQPMTQLTLNTSYRLTRPMAAFVNNVLLAGQQRINAIKDGPSVSWVQYPKGRIDVGTGVSYLTQFISDLIIDRLNTTDAASKLEPDDIFILASSIKSRGAESVRELENSLVSAGILCFVPISEEAKLDERIIKDKVVFTTMHQSKGRERKLVIVYGFDTSYYTVFKIQDKMTTSKICPNLLYVAATRASQELIIIEHLDTHYPLPFLHLTHSQMSATSYIQIKRHYTLENSKRLDKIIPLSANSNNSTSNNTDNDEFDAKPQSKSVSDLTKFIDERTLSMLSAMLEQVYTILTPPLEETSVEIPSDIKTGPRTYEQVADINGLTIPALLFCESSSSIKPEQLKTDRSNYLWKYLMHKYYQKTSDEKRNSFIRSYIDKIMCSGLLSTDMWLLLGNIFICANDGYNYKLKQITQYDWITQDMISVCHKNIRTHIPQDKTSRGIFEMELGCSFDGANAFYEMEHQIYGKIQLRGRVDCITDDTIWEFKCMESLNLESMLQLAIYAWIWKRIILEHNEKKNNIAKQIEEATHSSDVDEVNKAREVIERQARIVNKEFAGYDAYLEAAHKTTRDDLFYFRKFKLMNIRTGEVRELDSSNALLDEIMETVLAAKFRIKKLQTDEEFINESHARIKKYISGELHSHSMGSWFEEPNSNVLDEEDSNNVIYGIDSLDELVLDNEDNHNSLDLEEQDIEIMDF